MSSVGRDLHTLINTLKAAIKTCAFLRYSVFILLLFPLHSVANTNKASTQHTTDLQARLEASLEKHKVAGASVAIWQNNQLSTAAAGVTNVTTGVPITTDTIMHIGSISKILNTTLIMQLVDEGLVDLDKPLKTYLPDFTLEDKNAAEKITVKMLLNHTNGIDDEGALGYNTQDPGAQRVIDLVNKTPSMGQIHEPGKDLAYSNIGTVLAGYFAEQLREKSWYELSRERIYQPLDMHHAIAQPENALLHRASIGHTLNPETGMLERANAPFLSLTYAPAGSTLMMSATDLLTFARTQMNDGVAPNGKRLLSAKSARLMRQETAQHQQGNRDDSGFGLGWMNYEEGGVGHGGGPGVLSWLYMHPETGLAVAILTNSAHGMVVVKELLQPLFKDIDVPAWDYKTQVIIDRANDKPTDTRPYVGVYEGLGSRFIVKQRAEKLTLSTSYKRDGYRNVSPETQLWPAGDGYFVTSPKSLIPSRIYRFINPDKQGLMGHIGSSLRLFKRVD